MAKYLSPRDIDWTVLLIVMLICGVGVLQIYSATRDTDYTSAWWKQIIYVAGGLVLMWLILLNPIAGVKNRARSLPGERNSTSFRPAALGNCSSSAARLKRFGRRANSSTSRSPFPAAAKSVARIGRIASLVGSAVKVAPSRSMSEPVRNPPLASHPQIRFFPLLRASCIPAIT